MAVYTLIWEDHNRQYHLLLADGRLRRFKCVKHPNDDEDDAIQTAMDMAFASQSYPEIMESIFESHTFLFNDMSSAYHFFVAAPSPFIGCIRSLDVSLVLPYAEYRSYNHESGTQLPATQLEALQKSLAKLTFRDLRISLDVLDRQGWRKVPEKGISQSFGKVKVLNEYIMELPALFPGENEQHENLDMDSFTIHIRRRPPIRYWNFIPRMVECLTWKVAEGTEAACWVTSDTMGYILNPYHDA
ncbi:hypothetical protein PG994_000152 [Apiospora phragmitis]|uniref:Uncharacterized protein n=1 Tax=Apiospora phragmitis TaxID=2905665 RepID=A0ABR1X5M2_9PEZI